jgi:hypothetical protein
LSVQPGLKPQPILAHAYSRNGSDLMINFSLVQV